MTDLDQRIVRECEADLAERQRGWQELHDQHVRTEGARRFQAWLDAQRAAFEAEASNEYQASSAPWTFDRVADLRLRQNAPQADYRAAWVERLAALHAQRKAGAQ